MDYKNYNDYELLYMVKENDEEAMDILIGKYEPIIKKLAFSFYYSYEKVIELDDLMQEGRIAVFKTIRTYNDSKALFYTYVTVAIKHAMLGYCMKETNNKNKANINTICLEDMINLFSYEVNYSNICSDVDFYKDLICFKNNLLFLDSCIFELRFNSFSYADIANLLDISIKKVDNSLYKIKKKLKNYLLSVNN